jgi:SAM-dependent methyltransferase
VDGSGDLFSRRGVEDRTREWLAHRSRTEVLRLKARIEQAPPTERFGVFDAEGEPCGVTPRYFKDLLRRLKILRCFDGAEFASFLDVGSGMDHLASLVTARAGVPAYYADFVHVVNLPSGRLHGKLDHAFTVNLCRLPFPDGAFDVVTCSEVLEHLVRPVEAIAELLRITRRLLIVTSLEALAPGRRARWLAHHRVDVRIPHVERNFLRLHEIEALFGPGLRHEPLLDDRALPANSFVAADVQAAAYAGLRTRGALAEALAGAAATTTHGEGCMGIVLAKEQPGATPRRAAADDRTLAAWLVERAAEIERAELGLLRVAGDDPVPMVEHDRPVAAALLARACCPDCGGSLESAGTGARCRQCAALYDGSYGVPVLYPTGPSEPGEDDLLRRLCRDDRPRRRVVRGVLRRLRRNERAPSALKRAAWRVERLIGVR